MTIFEVVLRRRVSRPAVVAEMIVVLASLIFVVYLLSAAASRRTIPIILVSVQRPWWPAFTFVHCASTKARLERIRRRSANDP